MFLIYVAACFLLTLKCLSYRALPIVYKGVHLNLTLKKLFPIEISVRNLHHTCKYSKTTINQQQQKSIKK